MKGWIAAGASCWKAPEAVIITLTCECGAWAGLPARGAGSVSRRMSRCRVSAQPTSEQHGLNEVRRRGGEDGGNRVYLINSAGRYQFRTFRVANVELSVTGVPLADPWVKATGGPAYHNRQRGLANACRP